MKLSAVQKARATGDVRFIAYVSSVDDQAPESLRCIARIMLPDGSVHPVIFQGATKTAVREAARSWWAAEVASAQAKEANRAEAGRKISEAHAAKRSAQPQGAAA